METRLKQPGNPKFVEGYAKGVLSKVEHYNVATSRTEVSDDFEDGLANWVNVVGRLWTLSGNVTAQDFFGYAAGYYKTQLLSDSCRAEVTIQQGFITAGKSCVFICADTRMDSYYGLVIETGIVNNYFHIVRGRGPKEREILASHYVEVDPGDTAEIWYDRPNSTLRAYYNGAEVAAFPVGGNDIPHGPGRRYAGVIMGIDWFVAPGVLFEDFTAWDVLAPSAFIHDNFDSMTVDPAWNEIDDNVVVWNHFHAPNTLGPDNVLYATAAVLNDVEATSDSVKIVVRVYNFGAGTFTIVLCSNDDMTNWAGIQFDVNILQQVHVVTGTSPTDYVEVSDSVWELSPNGTIFVITYNDIDNKYRLYRNTATVPILEWEDESNVITHGAGNRFVGMKWDASLFTWGPSPSSFEAYNVSADAPLLPVVPEEGT